MGIITEYDKEIKLKRNARVGCPSATYSALSNWWNLSKFQMPQICIFLRDQRFMTWTKSQTSRVYFDVLWQWSFLSFSLYFPSITFKPLNSLCRFIFVFNEHNGFQSTVSLSVQQSIKVATRSHPWCMYFKSALKI